MATLRDLHQSITTMTKQNALALIMKLRASRLVQKKNQKFVKRVKKPKKSKDPLKNIDKTELLRLLKESLPNE